MKIFFLLFILAVTARAGDLFSTAGDPYTQGMTMEQRAAINQRVFAEKAAQKERAAAAREARRKDDLLWEIEEKQAALAVRLAEIQRVQQAQRAAEYQRQLAEQRRRVSGAR